MRASPVFLCAALLFFAPALRCADAPSLGLSSEPEGDAAAESVVKDASWMAQDSPVRIAAANYVLCKAAAAGDESICGSLELYPKIACPDAPTNYAWDICRVMTRRLLLAKALIARDPSAADRCRKGGVDGGERNLSSSQNERQCATLLSAGADIRGACRRSEAKGYFSAFDNSSCEKGARAYWGLAEPCVVRADPPRPPEGQGEGDVRAMPLAGGLHEIQGCLFSNAAAAFRRAHEAQDASLCGADFLCLAMMGKGAFSCRSAAAAVRDAMKAPAPAIPPPAPSGTGTAEIQWIKLPGGSFLMGSEGAEQGPVHRVSLKDFELAKTPVTNRQYAACVKAGACSPPPAGCRSYSSGGDQPVVCVDWKQAEAFSAWAGGRLPTEAEWEYAARSGGKDRKYPWGNEEPTCDRAVIAEAGGYGCGRKDAWPVCSKPAGNTEQGLCDMAGNVWQWVEDWHHVSYEGAPADGSAWLAPAGTWRVYRGGSWFYGPAEASVYYRGTRRGGYRFDMGFRPAK